LSHSIAWMTMLYTTTVNAVLHCGLMRINAVRTGSIRIPLRNRNPCKNFEHDGIHQELTRVTMQVYTGGTGSMQF
jgi:hypothetical protein